jgi:hypothetical protein
MLADLIDRDRLALLAARLGKRERGERILLDLFRLLPEAEQDAVLHGLLGRMRAIAAPH